MAMHVSAYLSKYVRHYLKCYFKKWRVFLWNSIPFLTVWMSPNLKKKVNSSSKLCIFFNQIVYFLLFFFFWWGWGGVKQFAIRWLPYFTLFFFYKNFLLSNLFYLLNKKLEISHLHCHYFIKSKIDKLFHFIPYIFSEQNKKL